jgi:hypothetical protein
MIEQKFGKELIQEVNFDNLLWQQRAKIPKR